MSINKVFLIGTLFLFSGASFGQEVPKMRYVDEYGVPENDDSCTLVSIFLPSVFKGNTLDSVDLSVYGASFPLAEYSRNKKAEEIEFSFCANEPLVSSSGITARYISDLENKLPNFYTYKLEKR